MTKLKTQTFSYHTHTNSQGIFDGKSSIEEMLAEADRKGYTEIGVSNHLSYHPNLELEHKMFFSDFNKALDAYQKNIEEIRTASKFCKVKVLVGFEVDCFSSDIWKKSFEKMKKQLDVDYLIGATHFVRDEKEEAIFNIYMYNKHEDTIKEKGWDFFLESYWQGVICSIESGYFDFIAHLDVVKNFGWCLEDKWNDTKHQVIETLDKYNQPYELNTSGLTKIGEQNPHAWMIEELNKRNVPIVISDDAHHVTQLAAHFEQAEKILKDMNYMNRWKLEK